mgnify:CR=1 FL=1
MAVTSPASAQNAHNNSRRGPILTAQSTLGESSVVLDLYAEVSPQYPKFGRFELQPWIFSTVFNFGGRSGLYGRPAQLQKALGCLSALRFGINTHLVEGFSPEAVNQALLLSQPAHLQRYTGQTLTAEERDQRRAQVLRELLGCSP